MKGKVSPEVWPRLERATARDRTLGPDRGRTERNRANTAVDKYGYKEW